MTREHQNYRIAMGIQQRKSIINNRKGTSRKLQAEEW
jgi:hypothetical protein